MKSRIERALRPLLTLPLSSMWRAAGVQILEFGPQRPATNHRGQPVTRADHALHVQCPWRILTSGRIVLASEDYQYESHQPGPRADSFFAAVEAGGLAVESVEADQAGSLRLGLASGYRLEVLPMTSSVEEEYWRYLPPGEASSHFVVTTEGIEGESDDQEAEG